LGDIEIRDDATSFVLFEVRLKKQKTAGRGRRFLSQRVLLLIIPTSLEKWTLCFVIEAANNGLSALPKAK
jgi:hypothetical protein